MCGLGNLLKAVAGGKQYDMNCQKGYGIVVEVAVPPFPYLATNGKYNPKGLKIYFKERLTANELDHIHFSEVAVCQNGKEEKEYAMVSTGGYVMCVTGTGKTVQKARDKAYSLTDKVIVPKMFYRNDIGLQYIENDNKLLREWGYL